MKLANYLKLLFIEWGMEICLSFGLTLIGLVITSRESVNANFTLFQLMYQIPLTALAITGLVVATRVLFLQIPASVYFRRREAIKNGFSLLQTLKIVLLVYIPPFSLFLLYWTFVGIWSTPDKYPLYAAICIPPFVAALAAPYLTYHW